MTGSRDIITEDYHPVMRPNDGGYIPMPMILKQVRYHATERAKAVAWAEAPPLVVALVEAYREAQAHVAEMARVLSFFSSIAPPISTDARELYFLSRDQPPDPHRQHKTSIVEMQWRDAIDALQRDANAKVPT